jgi:hypothetical protein
LRPVHLPDACRGGGRVVEVAKEFAPVRAELLRQHPVYGPGRQWRRRLLELDQRLPVRLSQRLGQGGLEHAQRLAHLHRAALELAKDAEQLLSRTFLDLGGDDIGRHAGHPLAETEHRPSGVAQWQRGELGGAGHCAARDVGHRPIVTDFPG